VTAEALVGELTLFILAAFLGVEVMRRVPSSLHRPFLSGASALSGITVVGALLAAGAGDRGLSGWLGVIAVAIGTVNVIGAFLLTDRTLRDSGGGATGSGTKT
jgi:proton-translocating NAD(P)+ transhydrogenase subunit alpha